MIKQITQLANILKPFPINLQQIKLKKPFSSVQSDDDAHYSFAIIGSGPAGFMCAKMILKKYSNSIVHMYEKELFPFGLLRYGVAPDHIAIKNVQNELSTIAENEQFFYYGNIEIGRTIQIEDIKQFYSAIIYAYGAESDKMLNIKGEKECKNVFGAQELVKWYNKHPDYYQNKDFQVNLKDVKNVCIIGNGNVAIDIARILSINIEELQQTEISDETLSALQNSDIQNIFILGRRGVVQSAFTLKELRSFSQLTNVKIYIMKEDLELNEASEKESTVTEQFTSELRANSRKVSFMKSKLNVIQNEEEYEKILQDNSHKKIILRYCLAPIELIADTNENQGNNKVRQIKVQPLKLQGEAFKQRSVPDLEKQPFMIDVDMVIRSIGYKSTPINKEIEWNEQKSVISSENGCVLDAEGRVVKGEYVAGWIKTGPIGVLDSTYGSSIETCSSIFNHIEKNELECKDDPQDEIEDLMFTEGIQYITFGDWKYVDEFEKEQGKKNGKNREKCTDSEQVFKVIKDSYPWTCSK